MTPLAVFVLVAAVEKGQLRKSPEDGENSAEFEHESSELSQPAWVYGDILRKTSDTMPLAYLTSGERKTRTKSHWLLTHLSDCPADHSALGVVCPTSATQQYKMYVLPHDKGVGYALSVKGYFEPALVPQIMSDFVGARGSEPGPGTYVDIGANVGDTTLPLAALLGGQRVVAVEPRRDLVALLKANLEANAVNDVRIYQYGLCTSAHGAVGFDDEKDNPAGSHIVTKGGDETVAVTTLDRLAREEPLLKGVRVMKIDVEGAEGQVILGGQQFLSEHAPCYLYVEFTPEWMEGWAKTPWMDVFPILQERYNVYDRTTEGGRVVQSAQLEHGGYDGLRVQLEGGREETSSGRWDNELLKPLKGPPTQYNWRFVRKDLGTCLANLRSTPGSAPARPVEPELSAPGVDSAADASAAADGGEKPPEDVSRKERDAKEELKRLEREHLKSRRQYEFAKADTRDRLDTLHALGRMS